MTSHAYDCETDRLRNGEHRDAASATSSNVTELASRRRPAWVGSVTVVLGGRHYGTLSLSAPVPHGERLTLYVVTQPECGGEIDCLVTDDPNLSHDGDR